MSYYSLILDSGLSITQNFSKIPPGVTSLSLRGNVLFSKDNAELVEAFSNIPLSVTRLDLSENNSSFSNVSAFAEALPSIPVSVTYLDLSDNNLLLYTGTELAKIFSCLPLGVVTLDLHMNDLFNKVDNGLDEAFLSLPPHITTLNLSDNENCYRSKPTGAWLVKVLLSLPPSISTLNLSNNNLYSRTISELIEIFSILSASLTKLILRDNKLFLAGSNAELAKAFFCFRGSQCILDLRGNNLEFDADLKTVPEAMFFKDVTLNSQNVGNKAIGERDISSKEDASNPMLSLK